MTDDHPSSANSGENRATENREVVKLRRLAHLLDSSIPLPGGYRIGLDGIIGLVPFLGDAVGASLSSYIVIQAAQLGVSTRSLLKMMVNIIVEATVGIIPVLGDVFDMAWKANERNIKLLNQQLPKIDTRSTSAKRRLTSAVLILISWFVLALILLMVAAVKLFVMLLSAIAA